MRGAFWWVDRYRQSNAYRDLTLAEQGAFRNLCDELWLRDGVLPDDQRILGNICGDATQWQTVKKAVLSKFYKADGGWRNKTHDEVSSKSQAFKDKQSAKGKKRAEQAARDGGRFQPGHQPDDQPRDQPEVPAENQPSVHRSPFSVNGSRISGETHIPRVPGTSTALCVEDAAKVDSLDAEIAFEERRFNELALPIRDTIQSVLDSLPRPTTRAPFSAARWTRTGLTGIGRSDKALTVLRLTNDALEAHQRAQAVPILSENNRKSFEAADRVLERLKAAQSNQPVKEIRG